MKFITKENNRFSNKFFLKYRALSNKILWDITINQLRIFSLA